MKTVRRLIGIPLALLLVASLILIQYATHRPPFLLCHPQPHLSQKGLLLRQQLAERQIESSPDSPTNQSLLRNRPPTDSSSPVSKPPSQSSPAPR